MKCSKNIGTADRVIRLIIALILLGLAYWKASWILLLIGLFVLFEALVGWCVVYHFLGKSSCVVKKKR
jgi:hypothetical protein